MKVCFVSHTADLGGAERSLLELVKGLRKRGIQCVLVLPNDGPLGKELKKISSILISSFQWWTLPRGSTRKSIKTDFETHTKLGNSLSKKIEKEKPDIVVTNTSVVCEGALAAKILNIPHIWYIRELGEKDHGFIFKYGLKITSQLINELSDKVIFNSYAVFKEFKKEIDYKKCKVVYNSISITKDLLKEKNSIGFKVKDSFKIIIAGTISRKKGQIDAIRAVTNLLKQGEDVELIIMGNCRNKLLIASLKKMIKKSLDPDRFQIKGFRDNPYVVMNKADLVLSCSKNEAFGRTMLEGMLLKKTVIGTKTGGIPEIITDKENGLLYTSGNYMELRLRISQLIRDGDLRRKIIKNGYKTATTRFTEENYVGEVLKIFESVEQDRK